MADKKSNQIQQENTPILSENWIKVHLLLSQFLDCVNEMNKGNYEKQPTNSIIPTTEAILKIIEDERLDGYSQGFGECEAGESI